MRYLFWLAVFSWLPTVLIWLKYYQKLRRYPQTFLYSVLAALLISVPWDIIAVNQGIWRFPLQNVTGINFLSLPLEEYLFIIFETVFAVSLTLMLKMYVRSK